MATIRGPIEGRDDNAPVVPTGRVSVSFDDGRFATTRPRSHSWDDSFVYDEVPRRQVMRRARPWDCTGGTAGVGSTHRQHPLGFQRGGCHGADRDRISVDASAWITFRGDTIGEIHHHLDMLTLLQQLGALPGAPQ
jgi:hypothetical protein